MDRQLTAIALEPGPPAVPTGRYSVESIPLDGGLPCLDFTYSAVWRATPKPHETLVDFPALVALSLRLQSVTPGEAEALLTAARERPDEADAVVVQAIALREAIYRVILAAISARPPRAPDLVLLNSALRAALVQAALHPGGGGFVWDWEAVAGATEIDLTRPLWPIARSTAELLTSPALARVKRCPGDGCGWLFLDTSKNGSRRWCDMAGCGNRARVRAFAARRRARRAATGEH